MNAQSIVSAQTASEVWVALHDFVAGQDRRRELRATLDLGVGKVGLLMKLATEGPMTLRDIAQAIDVDPPATTVAVNKLEARGLVLRAPHPDDNRRKLVHLTDAGLEAARRGQAILEKPPAGIAQLDSDDLARLGQILAQLQPD